MFVTPLGASATGPEPQRRLRRPVLLVRRQGPRRSRFIPFLHVDVTRRDTGERTRQYGPWFQIDAPDRTARVLFPFWGTYTDAQETRHLGASRPSSGCAATTATASTRCCRSTGGRRSATGGRRSSGCTTIAPRPACTTTASRRSSSARRTRNAASRPFRRLLTYLRNENNGESAWRWALLYFHKHDRESGMTTLFPVYWSFKRGGHETAVGFPFYWHVADAQARTDRGRTRSRSSGRTRVAGARAGS